MNQEICNNGLLQSGVKGLHQLVGQSANEPNGIGQQQRLFVRQRHLASGCVQGGKELVLDEHISPGEPPQQRGFASVGVADDSRVGHRGAFAVFALGGTCLAHLLQVAFEPVDLGTDFAFILFELAFALAFGADAAPLLAEVAPCTGEPWHRVFHSGQIDLKPRLAGLGTCPEDIKDDLLPVGDCDPGQILPVALLGRCEVVVEDDDVQGVGLDQLGELLGLARADEKARMLFAMMDEPRFDDRNTKGSHQLCQLLKQALSLLLFLRVNIGAYEQGALDHFLTGFDLKHEPSSYHSAGWVKPLIFYKALRSNSCKTP